ncbi:hemerythrin domain-containing protein [Thauera linaloolentis]|uniref:Hemerythrin HHE cation binding domain-containing protein n=1 Tax=Thauera linaloolentis (strain DSM 12138 / JCM 21573 / CCUG 41526 / CIP 105981 / IAM 15112 / NBRC 102519 / 47Lol) TaxID=1123367 RepID=N6Z2U2_THAL4|nr:hemerythrin domain-containing protein [Thauera linaloolentis]ENO86469.1 hemerythrin HHE cation binding domain-containing protein [Thauera linaloolentis 47Lol = DSM 12138]MCM8567348.1 hemerythrin domain-containing protein [Thauera linaloolentis]
MFLLDWLFGRRHGKPDAAPAPARSLKEADGCAPGTSIRYSADLVEHLVRDHHAMLECFAAIGKAARGARFGEAALLLERFRADLHGHLLVENVRLYVYLEHTLADDPASHALMREFRHDMDEIGKKVVAFLARYARLGEDPALAASFVADLDAVGAALADRIRREEDVLYPLYAPVA